MDGKAGSRVSGRERVNLLLLKTNSDPAATGDCARHDKKPASRRRLLLRDVSQAGDAAYLPANHCAPAGAAIRHRAETRERRPVPFDKIDIVGKGQSHFLGMFWFRQLHDKLWQ